MDTVATNELPEGTPDYIAKRRQGRETLLGLLYEAELKQDDLVKIVIGTICYSFLFVSCFFHFVKK